MSSLWTPDGERPVRRTGANPTEATPAEATPTGSHERNRPGTAAADNSETIDPALEAEYRAEMERLEEELLSAPAGDVIANHCYGLFQLAAMHLGQQPPHLEDAKLAIDALGAIVDTLGARIGPTAATLSEGLTQVRLAFVQIAAANTDSGETPAGS